MRFLVRISSVLLVAFVFLTVSALTPQEMPSSKTASEPTRPKLIVMIVVDQMRGDYVDKFRGQWTGGLKRMLEEGAWFRSAAYPYAATETCVGHATISTGSFPSAHGMIANSWWDREAQDSVTCTSDSTVQNIAYAGGHTRGGDSAVRMQMPAFAEELKFQTGGTTRVVAISLKARAAITLAGHKGDAVTWFDSSGALVTSSAYGSEPFVEDFAQQHPTATDFGKTWTLSLPESSYLYEELAFGASILEGFGASFPHPLGGKDGAAKPDSAFYQQWATSPFADTYLTKMAEAAIEALGLGKRGAIDYLGISYSSVDYVGHAFGPRSREIQDVLIRLDQDLAELLADLDQKIGRGNYVVALSADHGVAPIPADMQKTGVAADILSLPDLQQRIEKALEPFHLARPAIARISGNELYFVPGVYDQLKQNPAAMHAALATATSMPGVAAVYRAEDLALGTNSNQQTRTAFSLSYFPGRSGDLFILQKPYWLTGSSADALKPNTGTGHGTPYYYDQRVPILLFGYAVHPGEYFEPVTPADIAPTLGALTGVTLATRDGRVLSEALRSMPNRP